MTYIPGIASAKISATETGNSTILVLGANATFTGNWEDTTEWGGSSVSVHGVTPNAPGTLWLEESKSGITADSSVPFTVSDITIDVPRPWKNVRRYFRVRYVNGNTPQATTFSITTRYINDSVPVVSVMGETINDNSTGTIVKSVITGKELADDLIETGDYQNAHLLQDGALKVAYPSTTLYQKTRPTAPALPSGGGITISPTLNTENNVLDSGWIKVKAYPGGSLINIISDVPLDAYLMNASDASGNNIIGNTAPTLRSVPGFPATTGAAFFDDYFRLVVVNTSGTTANEYAIRASGNQAAATPVFTSLEQSVYGFYPAPLGRAVSIGKDPNGDYKNSRAEGYSTAATTQTALGIDEVFSSGCISADGYSQLSLELLADAPGVLTGIWYTDEACTNATRTLTIPYNNVNEFVPISSPTFGNYLVITYTNGGVVQNNFHLAIKFQTSAISGFVLGLDTPIAPNAVANLQRVVNSADLDRNRDKIIGQGSQRSSGYNETVSNTAFEVIWAGAYIDGAINYAYPQTAETVRIKAGGDVNDIAAGTGARAVLVSGLDENWNEVVETVISNGAAASVATTSLFYRVNSAKIVTVGTYGGANTGDIIIENTSSGQALAYIPAGLGNTQQAVYTVPAGKTAYITRIKVSVGQGNSADIRLFHIANADVLTAPFGPKHFEWGVEDYSGADIFPLETYLKVEEKNDIFADSKRITGSGTARVSFDFEYILVNN